MFLEISLKIGGEVRSSAPQHQWAATSQVTHVSKRQGEKEVSGRNKQEKRDRGGRAPERLAVELLSQLRAIPTLSCPRLELYGPETICTLLF